MASIINATTTNGVAISADNSGILQLATNSGTTALTLSAAQAATFVSSVTATSLTAPILNSATTLSLQTNGSTTAITIDASQNVGIGTNTITQLYGGYTQLDINGASGTTLQFQKAGTTYGNIINDVNAMYLQNNTAIVFGVGGSGTGTERMRIDSSGNVLVGTTTALGSSPSTTLASANQSQLFFRNTSATAGHYWQMGHNNDSLIVYNAANTGVYMTYGATSWTGTSDERLKENLIPISDAINKVSTLRAVTGNFIADETKTSRAFLIAQDVQSVLPEAVSETPDGHLGVAYTDVIPLLVASIKELKAIIDTQQTQITALNAKVGI